MRQNLTWRTLKSRCIRCYANCDLALEEGEKKYNITQQRDVLDSSEPGDMFAYAPEPI